VVVKKSRKVLVRYPSPVLILRWKQSTKTVYPVTPFRRFQTSPAEKHMLSHDSLVASLASNGYTNCRALARSSDPIVPISYTSCIKTGMKSGSNICQNEPAAQRDYFGWITRSIMPHLRRSGQPRPH
jgi:hypothetical protein